MKTQSPDPDAAERFLEQLRYELRHARRADRDDYIAQIADHIRESRDLLSPDDSAALDDLLSRIGRPSSLAQEFYAVERRKLSGMQRVLQWMRRWWVVVAVAAIVAAVVFVVTWASTYQPLSLQMNGGYLDKVIVLSGRTPVKVSGNPYEPVTWKLIDGRYRVSITYAATNDNSLGVTITPPDFANGWPLPQTWHLESNATTKQTVFTSARVEGHGYREIVFSTTFTCRPWPKGNPNSLTGATRYVTNLPLVMSFWGFQHTLDLAIQPFYLEFVGDCTGN